VDHTLRLIQHNCVVLAYNFNVVIWVLIIGEVMYRCIFAYPFIIVLSLLLPCIIILFLHLLSTNHKCTQPCYFSLLLKRAAQKERMDWRWGVLGFVLPRLSFLWCYGVFRCSVPLRVIIVFRDTIYAIIIIFIHDIWLSVNTFGRMCGTIDPGSCIRWVLGFGIKTEYDKSGTRAVSTVGMLA
jgi:hypothetical protein